MSFGATPLDGSTPAIPMSSVVPDGSGTPVALEGGPVYSSDASGNKAPVSMYEKDGNNVTIGARADSAITDSTTTNTHMSFLKGLVKIFNDIWDSTNHLLHINNKQIGGTTIDTNSGTKSAGTQRFVLATDQPQLTNRLLVTPDSVALPPNQSINVNQFGGSNSVTGTGASGSGIPRITVSNDTELQLWDGTNGPATVKASNTSPTLSDKALTTLLSPANSGFPVNISGTVQKRAGASSGSVSSLALAFSSNNAAGNSIIVSCGVGNGIAPTVTDSAGNTYTQAAQVANGIAFNTAIFFSVGPAAGGGITSGANTVTINNGGTTASIAMEIYEVSGLITQVQAQAIQKATSTGSSGTASTSAITPTTPNRLAFAAIGIGTAAQTITVGSGWTNDSGQQNPTTPAGLYSFVSMSQFLGGTTSSTTPQATFTSEPWAVAVALFKPVSLGIEGSVAVTNANANGQATMANSAPVTIASDQTNVPTNLVQIGGVSAQMTTSDSVAGANVLEVGMGLTHTNGTLVNRLLDMISLGDQQTQGVPGTLMMGSTDGFYHANAVRIPAVFKTIKAVAVTAGTPVNVWTPTSGKKFRVMGYHLSLSVAGSILFEDATGGTNEFWRTPLMGAGIGQLSPQLGNGFLSSTTNNALFLDVTSSGSISGYVFGTEE